MIRFLQKDSRVIKGIFVVIIGLAVVTMVITLVPGVFQDAAAATDTYATVRSGFPARLYETATNIKESEVQQTATRQMQQQRIPEAYLPYLMPRALQQAGTQLIQKALILREADRLGIKATDEDLRQFLHSGQFGQVLFPNGQYIGNDKYEDLISSNFHISTQEFESEVKKDIIINRLRSLVSSGATVSDKEVRDSYRDQNTKVKFEYAVLNADDIRKQINPTDSELQDFFKKNAARYATAVPEARKVQYIWLNGSRSGDGAATGVTSQEVQQYYTQHQKDYETPDQVKVRHILIQVPSTADAKTAAAAKAKADDLLKKIKAGGNFAELAKQNSDDPGSKASGGELGFLKHGATVPEFDKAAFTLSPGQTSEVIKTQFGYHILQVEEKQTAHTQALAEVKPMIEATLIRQKEAAQESAFAQQLTTEAQKNGLAKTAEAHHLPVVVTDFIAQGGIVQNLPDGSKMMQQALTMKEGGPPQNASTGEGYAVFQVVAIQKAHAPTFDSWKTHIIDDYRDQQAPSLLTMKAKTLEDKVKADGDLAKAAKEVGATMKTSDLVGHDGQVPDIGQLSSAAPTLFDLNVGQVSEPINTGRAGIVAKILDKQQPTADEIAKNFDQNKDGLLEERREEIFAVFVTSLETKAQKAGEIRLAKRAPSTTLGLGSSK